MVTQTVAPQTLVHRIRQQVQQTPDQAAFIFLKQGETESGRLTYRELDRQAKAIAALLQSRKLQGERALLIYPYEAGLEFITALLGCLYAGVVAVSSHPPRNRYAWSDLCGRLISSKAAIALSTRTLGARLQAQMPVADLPPTLQNLPWVFTGDRLEADPEAWVEPNLDAETLAFLQYTSGSTGLPKGVMVTHGSLLHNQRTLQLAFGHTAELVGMGWLPLFHDMGLIGNVLQPLYVGASCVLMSPIDFVQKPVRWLQAISRYRATTSGGPDFAYDLLCRQVTEAQRTSLDLSSWEVAFSGAEPVRPDTLDRFAEIFAPCGFRREAFYPCYGMAEATLFITGGDKTKAPVVQTFDAAALEENRVVVSPDGEGRSLVGCGHPWLETQVRIVDPETLIPCESGQVGEIWVAGEGLGKGYWHEPEQSDRTFYARLEDAPGILFLRTGDLGFWHGGELFITGRLHDRMVFWGLNHYPHHIEATVVACHPGFRAGGTAAVSVEVAGNARLVLLQEVERQYRDRLSLAEVVETIRWEVFQHHFVDVYAIALLRPGHLPHTPSGKIQRHRCRDQFLAGTLEVLEEWRSTESDRTTITSLIERYMNPVTHLRRYSDRTRGRLMRLLSGLRKEGQ